MWCEVGKYFDAENVLGKLPVSLVGWGQGGLPAIPMNCVRPCPQSKGLASHPADKMGGRGRRRRYHLTKKCGADT